MMLEYLASFGAIACLEHESLKKNGKEGKEETK